MPLTPQEQQELAQLQAELGQSAMPDKSSQLGLSQQQIPSQARLDFERKIAAKQAEKLGNFDYQITGAEPTQLQAINGVQKDIVRGFPVRNPKIPIKALVFHITAKSDIESQKTAMKQGKVGYNAIISDEGQVDFYSPFSLNPQQIKIPKHLERIDPRIPKEIRKQYGSLSNSNTVSIGIMKNLTEKNKPAIFDVAARFFAANNIPLEKNSIIGHGEIQYSPQTALRQNKREIMGKAKTPEGQEFKKFYFR